MLSINRLKPGTRLRSSVCTTEVIVVRPPNAEIELCCGGYPMLDFGAVASPPATIEPGLAGGTLLGKRYAHLASSLEALCTKSGEGTLTVDGVPLQVKAPKPLPSSD